MKTLDKSTPSPYQGFDWPGNHPASSIVLVESMGQLLPGSLQLLSGFHWMNIKLSLFWNYCLRVKLWSMTASHSSWRDFKIAGIEVADGGFGFTRGEHFTCKRKPLKSFILQPCTKIGDKFAEDLRKCTYLNELLQTQRLLIDGINPRLINVPWGKRS